jgi:hypothetical protein
MHHMNKSEVYSWRVNLELKRQLEAAARTRGISMAAALEQAVLMWLKSDPEIVADEKEQRRLHDIARSFVGAFRSDEQYSKEALRQKILSRLREKDAGSRSARHRRARRAAE